MDVLIERCAGLDVHRDTVVATVRRPGPGGVRRSETRTFTTMTGQLEALAEWLTAEKVMLVGMESTGIYWKPVVRHEALLNRAEVKGLRRWSVAAG